MAVNKKLEIGKGISALLGNITNEISDFKGNSPIPSVNNEKVAGSILRIPIEQIVPNPKQPRKDFDKEALQALSDSIAMHDIIQPITIIQTAPNKYQLLSGERRWRASKMAGLTDIPAYIRTADLQAQIELALLENLQREDLNAIEIALSYKLLVDEVNLTQEEVADRMHKERSTVTNYLRLLKLPPTIQQAVRENTISMGHAKCILGVPHIEQQLYAFNEIIKNKMSVRQAEALVQQLNKPTTAKASKEKENLAPAYKRIQDELASKFSTKVQLQRNKKGAGSIVLEFYNDNDLNRILEAIGE
jgi:ParB family transcriptional regulator, chromosome partitioning protein